MSKITPLNDLTSLTNEAAAVASINLNNTRIEQALTNTLSRDGSGPNQMNAELDMNGKRITNLPKPVSAHEPLRKAELDNFTFDLDQRVLAAEEAKVAAEAAQVEAETAASSASGYLAEVQADADNAENARAAAVVAQGVAESAKTSAEAAELKASQWAEHPQNTTIPGESAGTYSAKHWALVAQATSGLSASGVPVTPAGNISSSNVQAALEELDTEKASVAQLATKVDTSSVSTFGASLIDDTSAAAARNTLSVPAKVTWVAPTITWRSTTTAEPSYTPADGEHVTAPVNVSSVRNFILPDHSTLSAGYTFILTLTGEVTNTAILPKVYGYNPSGTAGVKLLHFKGEDLESLVLLGLGETMRFTWNGSRWWMECLSTGKPLEFAATYNTGGFVATTGGGTWGALGANTYSGSGANLMQLTGLCAFRAIVSGLYFFNGTAQFSSSAGGNTSGSALLAFSTPASSANTTPDQSLAGIERLWLVNGNGEWQPTVTGTAYIKEGMEVQLLYATTASGIYLNTLTRRVAAKYLGR